MDIEKLIESGSITNELDYERAMIAEKERTFLEKRRKLIQGKLKNFNLTQAELGLLLRHKSKTHMSELITGLKPFTLLDQHFFLPHKILCKKSHII